MQIWLCAKAKATLDWCYWPTAFEFTLKLLANGLHRAERTEG